MTTVYRFFAASDRTRKFLSHVQVDEGGCWNWTGHVMPNGYGQTNVYGTGALLAHRAAVMLVGQQEIPAGMQVDHLCRNRQCVRPLHLDIVTQAENIRRAAASKTHCPRGHEYTPENTRHCINRSGGYGRVCRACDAARKPRAS